MTQPRENDAVLGGNSSLQPVPSIQAKIRIEGESKAELDAIVKALQTVLEVEEESRDYLNRGDSGVRRYLDVKLRVNDPT
jgi:hypothetical protein